MVASSTDYAITKRGMSPQLRKRDKPLRTYGKRTQQAAAPTVEPPTKKRKLATAENSEKDVQRTKTGLVAGRSPSPEPTKSSSAEATNGAKGSILSYFKRVETTTVKEDKKKEQDDVDEEESTGSRKTQPARRKPRLLRLRATTSPTSSDDPIALEQDSDAPALSKKARSSKEPLEESKGSSGNQLPATSEKNGKKKSTAPVVQTTLNISPQAAFSECKVCDTVWNPLYPDDVKYHQKRHAATLRKNRGRETEAL